MARGGSRTRYGTEMRQFVLNRLSAGITRKELIEALNISKSFICQLRKTQDTFGTVDAPDWVRGQPRKITTAAAEAMLNLLHQDLQVQLLDHVALLNKEYGIQVSQATVSRKLAELNITHKRVERTNAAQDPLLRADYFGRMAEYSAEQCVFINESAANEHTAHS